MLTRHYSFASCELAIGHGSFFTFCSLPCWHCYLGNFLDNMFHLRAGNFIDRLGVVGLSSASVPDAGVEEPWCKLLKIIEGHQKTLPRSYSCSHYFFNS